MGLRQGLGTFKMADFHDWHVVVAFDSSLVFPPKSECPKIQEMETASFLSPGPGN